MQWSKDEHVLDAAVGDMVAVGNEVKDTTVVQD